MQKVTLYKYGEDLEHLEEQITQELNLEEIYKAQECEGKFEVKVFKENIIYNEGKDSRMEFLEEDLLYSEKIFLIIIIIKRDSNGEDIYWIRRGGKKYFIDMYKNTNYPLYYLANIEDYEKYEIKQKKEKIFDIFSGEKNSNTSHEIGENLKKYIEDINMYNNLIEELVIEVEPNTEIGRDLGLQKKEKIRFSNGIEIFIDVEDETSFLNSLKVILKIRNKNGDNTLKRFSKISKKPADINFQEIDDYSGVFIINNKKAINNKNNILKLKAEELDEEGKCNKKLIGFYFKGEKKYYINLEQKIYLLKTQDFDIRQLVSSEHKIIKYLNVDTYKSEDDFIKKIENVNDERKMIHVFHRNHYYKKNKSSHYEICDVLVYDKVTEEKFLIFVKYKYRMSSSEVFWQSSFVYKEFEQGNVKENELEELLEKVKFPQEFSNINFFIDKNIKFVNLILPEKGNVNTSNLDHVINLWNNDKMSEYMEIIIPETKKGNDGTEII